MARKIAYWTSTAIACLALFGSLSYLTGSAEVVTGFAKAGYPLVILVVVAVSYFTRPPNRRLIGKTFAPAGA